MNFEGEIITSRQNRIVIDTIKLADKKAREKSGLFRFDGFKLFEEAVEKKVSIKRILVSESKAEQLFQKISKFERAEVGASVSVIADELFSKISEEQSPEGIICVAQYPSHHIVNADQKAIEALANDLSKRILMLESLRDPGNMGTVLRSAAAFGVDTVIISRDCADVYNPKTVRAAMGALFKVSVVSCNDFCGAVEILKNSKRQVYAAALDKNAVSLGTVKFEPFDVAVIGNEGHGLSAEALSASSRSLYIPMEDGCESLNAAIAASVIMWSMYKG